MREDGVTFWKYVRIVFHKAREMEGGAWKKATVKGMFATILTFVAAGMITGWDWLWQNRNITTVFVLVGFLSAGVIEVCLVLMNAPIKLYSEQLSEIARLKGAISARPLKIVHAKAMLRALQKRINARIDPAGCDKLMQEVLCGLFVINAPNEL